MALQHATLRPGLLVSVKSSISGNVSYSKRTIEADHVTPTGAKLAVWETERKIADPEEHTKAQKARDAARHLIAAVCSATSFGYLCPEDQADALEEAIVKAREIAAEFNKDATISNVSIYVMTGRVAQDDVEAVRAINSEVRDLLTTMEDGLKNLDVKSVRAAAIKAKNLGQMLSAEASDKIKVAIELARKSAKAIVKAGEGASQEIDLATVKKIETQRHAFLDFDDQHEIVTPIEPGRAIEFAPTP